MMFARRAFTSPLRGASSPRPPALRATTSRPGQRPVQVSMCGRAFVFVDHGRPAARIEIPVGAGDIERRAAEILRTSVLKMSGVDLPVLAVKVPDKPGAAVIGFPGSRASSRSSPRRVPKLREDGFILATSTGNLYIAGGGGKGVIYGVVHLLEKYFGCRKFSPSAELFPPGDDLALGCLFETDNPVNAVRIVNGDFALDPDYLDWMRLQLHTDLYGAGYYVHTFQRLIPWQTHFEAHPEYFALMNGKRIIDQPCLSRPEVFDIAAARLREEIAAQPGEADLVGQPERQFLLLPVPRLPQGHRRGGLARGPHPPLRQPDGRPLPRQDHLDPGLSIFAPGAAPDPAGPERRGHALHDRARPQPPHRRRSVERFVRPRHRGLEPDLRQSLSLGLHGQLLAPRLPLPQPPRPPAQHPLLRRPRRPQAFPADEHRPGARIERAEVLPSWPAFSGTRRRTSTPGPTISSRATTAGPESSSAAISTP